MDKPYLMFSSYFNEQSFTCSSEQASAPLSVSVCFSEEKPVPAELAVRSQILRFIENVVFVLGKEKRSRYVGITP